MKRVIEKLGKPGKLFKLVNLWIALICCFSLGALTQVSAEESKPSNDSKAKADSLGNEKKNGVKERFGLNNSGDKNEPLFIKSDTLSLDANSRVFTYKGNVEATRGDLIITSDTMIGKYDEQNRIETVVGQGNVVITRGQDMRASSDRAVYNVAAAKIELTEGPELYNGGNALSADKVIIWVDEDRSEAEGEVRVKVIKTQEQN